ANCWSTIGDTGWMGTFSPEPWYMGLTKPGSFEAGYMASFMKAAGFEALIPRFDDSAYSDFGEQKVLASREDGSVAAAYFYNNDLTTGTIKGLDDRLRYRGFWFDPLTGKYIPAGRNIKPQKGMYTLPEKPNTGDWAFLLSSRILSAPGPTEPMTAHSGNTEFRTTDFPGSLQKPVITSLGSAIYGKEGLLNTAPALTDGDIHTEWRPFAAETTQTIVCDMREKKAVTGINIIFGDGSFDPHIRIMGSNDGVNQTVLQDTKTVGKGMFKNNKYGERFVFSRSLNGKYRYVTVLVFGSGDRNTPKSIAELELWAK
ncbi:MAG: discoidin domain-containing protein, partial [Abditibacteriota bacterium]|nr:discoidin domain-containing protein [Abditibacteriota bacterium]